MRGLYGVILFVVLLGVTLGGVLSCAGSLPRRPCTDGGELARPGNRSRVTKQCYQKKEPSGRWVNDGPYIEWHKNGKRALKGEYRMGAKNDKWEEWDPAGKLLSTTYYQDGKVIPRFDEPAKPVLTPSALPAVVAPQPSEPLVTQPSPQPQIQP